MNLYKKIPLILGSLMLIIALLGSAIFACLWIDRSISLGYMEASFITSENAKKDILLVLNSELKDKDHQEITNKLKKIINENPNENLFIKNENDIVWFGSIRFEFRGGKLKEIHG